MESTTFKRAKWVVDERYHQQRPLDLRAKARDSINNLQENPDHPPELKNTHVLFRLKFEIDHCRKVILNYSADDIARIYVNGRFVEIGPAPSYHFRYDCNSLDITDLVHKGMNVVGAHLYYQGELNLAGTSGDLRIGFIAEVTADEEIAAYTDERVLCRVSKAFQNGGLTGYRTQYLENFDANEWEYRWNEVLFDDTHWTRARAKENNDHVFRKQVSRSLQCYDVAPIERRAVDEHTILFDFGCEYAGTVYFQACGKKGDVIEVRCAEELDEQGRARYEMRCNCTYRQKFILSGRQGEWPEYFDYMGFRYAELILPGNVTVDNVVLKARNYPFDYDSTFFKSSSRLLNDIWTICKNGVRTGTQAGYLDCPTREKGLYLGDGTITAQSHFYLTGDISVYKRALRGFADSTYYLPAIQGTCLNHYFLASVDYSFQFPLNLLIYYKHTGDNEFLEEMLPYCERMMNYYRNYEKDLLLYDVINECHIVDWPRKPYDFTDGYDFDLEFGRTQGTHNVMNAFYIGAHKNMNAIRDILGKDYEDRVSEMKKVYVKTFYDPASRLFRDTPKSTHKALHSNILPLYYMIAPEESVKTIIELIRTRRLNCGVYMAYFLLKALANYGEHDLIYELLVSEDVFSWSNMIREGASTCFEAWGKEYKWNTSLCHPWASAPVPILIEDILGITPRQAGWKGGYNFNPKISHNPGGMSISFWVNGYRLTVETR